MENSSQNQELRLQKCLEEARTLKIVVEKQRGKIIWSHPDCKIDKGQDPHEEEISGDPGATELAKHIMLHRIPPANFFIVQSEVGRGKKGLE